MLYASNVTEATKLQQFQIPVVNYSNYCCMFHGCRELTMSITRKGIKVTVGSLIDFPNI